MLEQNLSPSTPTELEEYLSGIVEDKATLDALRDTHRADLLPLLFRVKGKPYSLEDYPQFRIFYDKEYASDFICMSARQCGKSLNLSNSEVLDCIQIPHFQILYIAPLQSQAQRFSVQYLSQSIRSCPYAQFLQDAGLEGQLSDSKIIKAVFHNSFATGSGVQVGYAKTSADRLRGITVDRIDFDELQDQQYDNIPIVKESLTTSEWKVCRYTGTAKTLDNTIETFWRQSSRCEWVMKCDFCNHWNIPDDQDNCRCLRMVQADGMHCLRCGRRLNVRKGQWVPFSPDKMKSFRGYHISQVIVPANVENPHRWNEIIKKISTLPLTTIKNETLGISSSTGLRLITSDDITKYSCLPKMADLQTRLSDYVMTFGGLDWGGAEQTSFTVHTIIGMTRDGQLHVLYARRYMGFDPDSRLADIARAHQFYGCTLLAADYGMGFDMNVMLIRRFGIPVVQMQFTGNQRSLLRWSPRLGYPCWTVDKVTALTTLFVAIKYGKFRFPCDEHFKLYTQDLLSPYEEVVDRGGIEKRQFVRDPAMPDDFAMALCFGSMAAFKAMYGDITELLPQHSFNPADALTGTPDVSTAMDPREMLKSAN